jgi:predicted dehydrogenase
MQLGRYSLVEAIASREIAKAKSAANSLDIPKYYGSYEEMLKDSDIDAIYNPLPNHLHVEWTVRALKAGKHVLCEKPIGMDAGEAETLLIESRKYPHLKVMEAFMYRFHSQWKKTKELVEEGAIGEVRTIHSFFSYRNLDPENIRNREEVGGGGLMDIGCYCISFPRFIFNEEPERIVGEMDFDPEMKTDRMSSAILHFPSGRTSTFTCSTQLMPYQRAIIYGTGGHITVEIPVNAPPDTITEIILQTSEGPQVFDFPPEDQYTIQGDAFSEAILLDQPVPVPLEDAVANMKVIDAIRESNRKKQWIDQSNKK